jgi:hypothetical protein
MNTPVRLLVTILLAAAAAQAQPVVTEESTWRHTSSATTYRPSAQAAPVVADGGGFLVTWSEVADGLSRAYAGRLDASGRLLSVGVRTGGEADAASVAPFGDRIIAAWLEPGVGQRPLAMFAALDRSFQLVSVRPVELLATPPIVRTTGSRAFVGADAKLYEVDRDGAPLTVVNAPGLIDDLAAVGSNVGFVSHSYTPFKSFPNPCHPFTICVAPGPVPEAYTVVFTWLYRLTSGTSASVTANARTAVAGGGDSFLVVWFEPGKVKGSLFGSTFMPFLISSRVPEPLDARAQPQVAWDGQRWIAVWSADGSVLGAAVTPDAKVTTFDVSARGKRPAINAAVPSRFLVTYEVVDSDTRHLGSRLIDFTPPGQRERAVR